MNIPTNMSKATSQHSPDFEGEIDNNLKEFRYGVRNIELSRYHPEHSSKSRAIFRIDTLEGKTLTVFMSVKGYAVCCVGS